MADFVFTESTKERIRGMNGREIKLAGRLFLNFYKDICTQNIRIPEQLLLTVILHPNERLRVASVGDTMPVRLIEPEGHISWIKLVKTGHLVYALGGSDGEWPTVVSRNGFRVGIPIDLWAFLDGESKRCFAMEYVCELAPNQGANQESGDQDGNQEDGAVHEGADEVKESDDQLCPDQDDADQHDTLQKNNDQHRSDQDDDGDQQVPNKEVEAIQ